jgi:hypothetical protein
VKSTSLASKEQQNKRGKGENNIQSMPTRNKKPHAQKDRETKKSLKVSKNDAFNAPFTLSREGG